MNKIIKCFLFALLVTVVSCNNAPKDVVVFKLEQHDFKSWNEIMCVESVDTFEQGGGCVLSYADKCVVTDDFVFFDDHKSKAIYQFTKKGEYVRRIGNRGKSKSEYIDIMDCNLDKSGSNILIMDERGMVSYDVVNGKFVGRQKFHSDKSIAYERFIVVGEDSFLCATNIKNAYSMVLDNPQGETGLRDGTCYPFVVDFFYKYNNTCHVLSDFGRFYIDKYENGHLIRKYEFDLNGEELPEDALPQNYDEFEKVYNDPEYFKCMTEAYESPKWLCAKLDGPKSQEYTAIINKKNGKYAFGADFPVNVVGTDGNSFYSLVYPAYLPDDSFMLDVLRKRGVADDEESPVLLKFSINESMLQ